MSTKQIPYIHWGDYKSKDVNNPDLLEIEVTTLQQFESEFSTNIQCRQLILGTWEDRILPLNSHDSNNGSLLKMWDNLVKRKRIIVGSKIVIHTYLGVSINGRDIRKFRIEV